MFDAAVSDIAFRTRPLGFDRQEVRAFIGNLLEDYEKLRTELDRLRASESPARSEGPAISAATRELQRVLEGAQRVADDIEHRAAVDSQRIIEDAHAQAAEILATAQRKAAEITAGAQRDMTALEARAAVLRAHFGKLRAAFESAADTAGAALSDIAETSVEHDLASTGSARVGA
jgi:cell division septum initiation protein DivIVA